MKFARHTCEIDAAEVVNGYAAELAEKARIVESLSYGAAQLYAEGDPVDKAVSEMMVAYEDFLSAWHNFTHLRMVRHTGDLFEKGGEDA